MTNLYQDIFLPILQATTTVLLVAISVAFLVYFERKIIAQAQLRVGPNVVGPFGLLQSFADALKSIFKETILPSKADKIIFLLAPLISFCVGFSAWAVIPFSESLVFANVNLGVTYLLAMSAIGVYGIILAGWASNSKYAFFGAIRSASQMISYEVSIGFIVLSVATLSGSLNLQKIIESQRDLWFFIPLFPLFIIFFISILAETNRHPFDLPEAESELVSGYNVEYSSMAFTLFFLTEYANMMAMSTFCSILFLGGWLPPLDIAAFRAVPGFIWLALKVIVVLYFFILVRITLPRYRYDQLMRLGWKIYLPFTMAYFVAVATIKVLL